VDAQLAAPSGHHLPAGPDPVSLVQIVEAGQPVLTETPGLREQLDLPGMVLEHTEDQPTKLPGVHEASGHPDLYPGSGVGLQAAKPFVQVGGGRVPFVSQWVWLDAPGTQPGDFLEPAGGEWVLGKTGPLGDLALRWCLGPCHRSGRLLAPADSHLRVPGPPPLYSHRHRPLNSWSWCPGYFVRRVL